MSREVADGRRLSWKLYSDIEAVFIIKRLEVVSHARQLYGTNMRRRIDIITDTIVYKQA